MWIKEESEVQLESESSSNNKVVMDAVDEVDGECDPEKGMKEESEVESLDCHRGWWANR